MEPNIVAKPITYSISQRATKHLEISSLLVTPMSSLHRETKKYDSGSTIPMLNSNNQSNEREAREDDGAMTVEDYSLAGSRWRRGKELYSLRWW